MMGRCGLVCTVWLGVWRVRVRPVTLLRLRLNRRVVVRALMLRLIRLVFMTWRMVIRLWVGWLFSGRNGSRLTWLVLWWLLSV